MESDAVTLPAATHEDLLGSATGQRPTCSKGELTHFTGVDILVFVEGTGGAGLSERELVESVLRDLAEAADRWEALVAQAESVTYSVDLGDIRAVANSDGKLIDLVLAPGITADYSHGELAGRLNTAFTALRMEVEDDYLARYGGELT